MSELEQAIKESGEIRLALSHLTRRISTKMTLRTKPVFGGSFGWCGFALSSLNVTVSGLDEPIYSVMHEQSRLVLSSASTKADALAGARKWLQAVQMPRLLVLVARFVEETKEAIAKEEADAEAAHAAMMAEQPRPGLTQSVPKRRRQIFDKSDGKCHYCQTVLDLKGRWHIEHMMPRALLGSNEQSNLVAACVPCNAKKRDKTAEEFVATSSR